MTSLDPIIAVNNVKKSAEWYEKIFGFINAHGGDHFAVLTTPENKIILCLHAWEADNHPTMMESDIPAGNGFLLYFRTSEWESIHQNLKEMNWPIEAEIHLNPNSLKKEFSFRDPDGYFLTITEFHEYEG